MIRMMKHECRMTKSENRNISSDESFWYNDAESMVREESAKPRVYDLEERTARFGEAVIDFVKHIPPNAVTNRLVSQLVGAATSVGANYVEADDAVSKKGISEEYWNLSERSAQNQAFSSNDRSGGSGIETASSRAVATKNCT